MYDVTMAGGAVQLRVTAPSNGFTATVRPVGPGIEPVGLGAAVAVVSASVACPGAGAPGMGPPATAAPAPVVGVTIGTVGKTSWPLVPAAVGVVGVVAAASVAV